MGFLELLFRLSDLQELTDDRLILKDTPTGYINRLSQDQKRECIFNELNALKDKALNTLKLIKPQKQADSLETLINHLLLPLIETPDYADDILDFCLTFHGFLDCISPDKPFFTEKDIGALIQTRDSLIRGTLSDYFHQTTPANSLCLRLQSFFKEEAPLSAILDSALKNDTGRWYDFIENTFTLPRDLNPYFRTSNNSIHRYDALIEGAIAAYRRDPFEIELWKGSDKRQDDGKLTGDEIATLAEKSPTLKTFLEVVNQQSKQTASYEALSKLRRGLLIGDVNHQGEEMFAAAPANVAISEFSDWWQTQSRLEKKLIRQLHTGQYYLGSIIDILLDPTNAYKRHAIRYCIQILGDKLESILKSEETKVTLLKECYQPPKDIEWCIISELTHPNENKQLKTATLFKSNHGLELYLFYQSQRLSPSLHDFINAERALNKLINALYCDFEKLFKTYSETSDEIVRHYFLKTLLSSSIRPKSILELLKREEKNRASNIEVSYLKSDKDISKDILLLSAFQTKHFPLIEHLLSEIEDIKKPYRFSSLTDDFLSFNGCSLLEAAFMLHSAPLIQVLMKHQTYVDLKLINAKYIDCLFFLLKGALEHETSIDTDFLNQLCEFSLSSHHLVTLSMLSDPYFHVHLSLENKKRIVIYVLRNNCHHILSKWKDNFPLPYNDILSYLPNLRWETIKTLCENSNLPNSLFVKFFELAKKGEIAHALLMLSSFCNEETCSLFQTDEVCEIAFKENSASLVQITHSQNREFLMKYPQKDEACLAFLDMVGFEGISDGTLTQILFAAIRKENVRLIEAIINASPKHLESLSHLHSPIEIGDEFQYKHLGQSYWLKVDKIESNCFYAHDVINRRPFHGNEEIFSNHCITLLGAEEAFDTLSKEKHVISPLDYALKEDKPSALRALLKLGAAYEHPLFINEPFEIQRAYLLYVKDKEKPSSEDLKITHAMFIKAVETDNVELLRFLFAHFKKGINQQVLCQLAFFNKKTAVLKYLLQGESLKDSEFLLRPPYDLACFTILFDAYLEQKHFVSPELLNPIFQAAFLCDNHEVLYQLAKLGANRECILNKKMTPNQLPLIKYVITEPLEKELLLESFYHLYLLERQLSHKLSFFKKLEWERQPQSLDALLTYVISHPKSLSQKVLLKLTHHYIDNSFHYDEMREALNKSPIPPEKVIYNEDRMAYLYIRKRRGETLPRPLIEDWLIDAFITQHPYSLMHSIPQESLSFRELAPFVTDYNYPYLPSFLKKEELNEFVKEVSRAFHSDKTNPRSPLHTKTLPTIKHYNDLINAIYKDQSQHLKTLFFNVIKAHIMCDTSLSAQVR